MSIQLFTMGVDWCEIITCLMEVFSIMFNICRYCDFTWYGRGKCGAQSRLPCYIFIAMAKTGESVVYHCMIR